MILPGNIAV